MFDLTTYVKKWRIRQLKTVFSTLDTLCYRNDWTWSDKDEDIGLILVNFARSSHIKSQFRG